MKGLKTVAEKGRISSWSVFRIILFPCMLLCTITKKPVFQWIALGALIIWVSVEIGHLIARAAKRKRSGTTRAAGRTRARKKRGRSLYDDKSLFLQVNYRITEQLNTSYPDVTWLWINKPDSEEIRSGGTWRISLQNADPFNYAEVSLQSSGAMEIDLMQVLPLGEVPVSAPEPDSSDLKEDEILPRFDVRKWYSDIGETVLCGIVEELNTQGFKQLRISESGDVRISSIGGEKSFTEIGSFPPKSAWDELCSLLREDDLRATVSGSQIAIAW